MTEQTITIAPFTITVGEITVRLGLGLGLSGTGMGGVSVTPATFDPANKSTHIVLSNANLTADSDGLAVWGSVRSTTSKAAARGWSSVMAVTWGANGGVGFCNATQNLETPGFLGGSANSLMWRATGDVFYDSVTTTITGYAAGDTLYAYYDPATDTFEGFVNGVSAGTRSAPGLGATFFAAMNTVVATCPLTANFTTGGPGGKPAWDT